VLWLYSNYIEGEDPSDASIASFAESRIQIAPEHKRPSHIDREFSMDSPLLNHGSVVVGSLDEARRLVFVLRVASTRDPEFVKSFAKRPVMSDFFETASDFTTHPNQVVVKGEDTLQNWLDDSARMNTMHSSIIVYLHSITEGGIESNITLTSDRQIVDSQDVNLAGDQQRTLEKIQRLIQKATEAVYNAKGKTARLEAQEKLEKLEERMDMPGTRVSIVGGPPYFFMNDLVHPGVMLLAQNTDTLEKAVAIAETWYGRGHNPGPHPEPSASTAGYTFYSYVNEHNITPYTYAGSGPPVHPIKIMGYQVGGTKRLTVLLDL
jgi:hypothetical protein